MRSVVATVAAIRLRARRLRARRAMRDLALGARLAVAGGRASAARLALAAAGVAVSVTALLLISAAPGAVHATNERSAHRDAYVLSGSNDPLLVLHRNTQWRDDPVRVVRVEATGPTAPTPPGVARNPGPGEVVVSPALRRVLDGDSGDALRPRVPGTVIGEIADAGLAGPAELVAYVGADDLDQLAAAPIEDGRPTVLTVHGFDPRGFEVAYDMVVRLLLWLVALVAIVPMVVLIAASARIGSATRDRRLASIRLLGVGRAAAARIVVGETLVGVVAGLAVAAGAFVALAWLAPLASVGDHSVFTGDVRPPTTIVVLLLTLVPAVAAGAALVALRPVMIEPVAVTRELPTRRRRLWWRLVLPAVAVAALLGPVGDAAATGTALGVELGVVAIAVVMLSAAAVLPWLVEASLRVLPSSGPTSWELARAALAADGGASARMLGMVTSALLGGITFITLTTGMENRDVVDGTPPAEPDLVHVWSYGAADLEAPVRGSTIVRDAWFFDATRTIGASTAAVPILFADCAGIAAIAHVASCADGDVLVVEPVTATPWVHAAAPRAGDTVRVVSGARPYDLGAPTVPWTMPAGVVTARATPAARWLITQPTVVWTRGAAPDVAPSDSYAVVRVDPGSTDALDHLRSAYAGVDQVTVVSDARLRRAGGTGDYHSAFRAAIAGVALVALLAGVVSLVALAIERIRARRHALATLVAGGCRTRVLAWSLAWQLATPTAACVLIAVVGGAGLGLIAQRMLNLGSGVHWGPIALVVAAAAVAVAVATATTWPVLRRACHVAELRTE